MRKFVIPSNAKKLLSLSFCENNSILPVSINGKKLTLLCADPTAQACKSTVVMLKDKYEVNVLVSTVEEIREIITDNFYSRCHSCSTRIDSNENLCGACIATSNTSHVVYSNQYLNYDLDNSLDGQIILQSSGNIGTGVFGIVNADESHEGKLCPYCQTNININDQIIVCSECGIPHHKECWSESGGCTTYGCRLSPAVIGVSGNFQPFDMSPDYSPNSQLPPVNYSYMNYNNIPRKSRGIAVLLAILFGLIGIHKFYLGDIGWGLAYLLGHMFSIMFNFIPTVIIMILVLYDIIVIAIMPDEEFYIRYG